MTVQTTPDLPCNSVPIEEIDDVQQSWPGTQRSGVESRIVFPMRTLAPKTVPCLVEEDTRPFDKRPVATNAQPPKELAANERSTGIRFLLTGQTGASTGKI